MKLKIRRMSNVSPDFYRLLGPLMGSRKVEKEVGIRIYDDQDKEWYLAWLGGAFAGVASVRGSVISDCYVKPSLRGNGAMKEMLASILADNQGRSLKATCTPMSLPVFLKAGFKVSKELKNFTMVEI